MTKTHDFSATEAAILVEVFQRQRDLKKPSPYIGGRDAARAYFAARREYECGPEWNPADWFGPLDNAERIRICRALTRLEERGLLIRWAMGNRTTHVRLTDVGVAAAEPLAVELGAAT